MHRRIARLEAGVGLSPVGRVFRRGMAIVKMVGCEKWITHRAGIRRWRSTFDVPVGGGYCCFILQ